MIYDWTLVPYDRVQYQVAANNEIRLCVNEKSKYYKEGGKIQRNLLNATSEEDTLTLRYQAVFEQPMYSMKIRQSEEYPCASNSNCNLLLSNHRETVLENPMFPARICASKNVLVGQTGSSTLFQVHRLAPCAAIPCHS